MKELTHDMINESFLQTGVDVRFFPIYEAELKRCYKELYNSEPDNEDTPEEDSNITWSIRFSNEYIVCYAKEIEKGHSEKWAISFARNTVYEENDNAVVYFTCASIEDRKEMEKELEIHANTLSEDRVFKERYKMLIKEYNDNAYAIAEEYTKVYHYCIAKGKSEPYAQAYSYAINNYNDFYCDIYARAYEAAITNGEDGCVARIFGDYCTDAADQGYFIMLRDFSKKYKEDWQREFYIQLICDDVERDEKRSLTSREINELRNELFRNDL